jgi:superfamily II DNA or RNA helicase
LKFIIDNVRCRIEDINIDTADDIRLIEIDNLLAIKQPGYFFSPAFKANRWDGRVRFFDKKTNSFPTGLLEKVLNELECNTEGDIKNTLEIVDTRDKFHVSVPDEIKLIEPSVDGGFITLRDYQYDSVKNAIDNTRGIVNVATNGGKTEIASGIIQQLLPHLKSGQTILFVTHNKEIFHQSAKRIEKRLNIKVGKVGDGKWDIRPVTLIMIPTVSKYINPPKKKDITYTGEIKSVKLIVDLLGDEKSVSRKDLIKVIQMFENVDGKAEQTAAEILSSVIDKKFDKEMKKFKKALQNYEKKKQKKEWDKHDNTMELLKSAVCFIGDEFHHSSSSTWYDTLQLCENAVYRFGLTGTVDKKDEINVMRMYGCTGDIVSKISNDFLISNGYSAKPTIFLEEINTPVLPENCQWQEAYKLGITENVYRNKVIAKRVTEKYREGKGCLVLTNHINHGENILEMLRDNDVEAEFTHGGRSSEDRENLLQGMRDGKLKVLIATSILDEGVDISGINCVWLAGGGKSFRQLLQRIGRGLRTKEDGSGLEVFDYLDYTQTILTKHTMERYQYYKDEKFDIKKIK